VLFDRVYVVHLPNPERRAAMDAELARLGLEAEYVHAKPPRGFTMSNMRRNPAAEFGCALSHIKAIVRAAAEGQRPLIIEDDVRFVGLPQLDLPADWELLYLGGHPRSDVQRASDTLVRVGTFSFAEAYVLRNPLRFLEFWTDQAGQPDAMIDLILGRYAALGGGYCTYPLLTHQPAGYSQIGLKVDDKSDLVRRAWQKHLSTR
jgi:hypothetical protein